MKKQQNIEAVVANAATELDKTTVVSNTPVDEDWISSFFDFVANVSSEQMQILWGKVLAGEIEKPDSFSIRTLDVLRKMTREDAICFSKIVPLVLKCPGDKEATFYDFFVPGDLESKDRILEKCGITFPDIVRLDEAQLISANSLISVGNILRSGESILFEGPTKAINVKNVQSNEVEVYCSAYLLTAAGVELLSVVSGIECGYAPEWYLQEFAESLAEIVDKSSELEISVV